MKLVNINKSWGGRGASKLGIQTSGAQNPWDLVWVEIMRPVANIMNQMRGAGVAARN